MADFNPLTSLPDPKDYTGTNMGGTFTLPGFFDANRQREQQALPFIEMAKKLEAEKMQQEAFKNREYQSNPMVQGRLDQAAKQGLENDRYKQVTPFEVQQQQAAAQKGMMANQVTQAGLGGEMDAARRKPLTEVESNFARMHPDIQKAGPLAGKKYLEAANAAMNNLTDSELKEQFRKKYIENPHAGVQQMMNNYQGQVMTPDFYKSIEVANTQAKAHVEAARLAKEGTLGAAVIRERSAKELQQMQLDNPKNAAVMVLRAKSFLASPPPDAKPEQLMQAQGIVEGDLDRQALEEYKAYAGSLVGVREAAEGKPKTVEDFRRGVFQRNGMKPDSLSRKMTGAQDVPKIPQNFQDFRALYPPTVSDDQIKQAMQAKGLKP